MYTFRGLTIEDILCIYKHSNYEKMKIINYNKELMNRQENFTYNRKSHVFYTSCLYQLTNTHVRTCTHTRAHIHTHVCTHPLTYTRTQSYTQNHNQYINTDLDSRSEAEMFDMGRRLALFDDMFL